MDKKKVYRCNNLIDKYKDGIKRTCNRIIGIFEHDGFKIKCQCGKIHTIYINKKPRAQNYKNREDLKWNKAEPKAISKT